MKQETIEEAAEKFTPQLDKWTIKEIFINGAKWQMDKQDEFAIGFLEFTEGTYSFGNIMGKWYSHADTSKEYTTKELLEQFKNK